MDRVDPRVAEVLGLAGFAGSEVQFMDEFYQLNRDMNVEVDEETGLSYNLSGMPWEQCERTAPSGFLRQAQKGGDRGVRREVRAGPTHLHPDFDQMNVLGQDDAGKGGYAVYDRERIRDARSRTPICQR